MARIRTSEKRLAVRLNPHARCFERWSRERDTFIHRHRRRPHASTCRPVPSQAIRKESVSSPAAGAAAGLDCPRAEPTRNLLITSHFRATGSRAILAAQSAPSAEPTRNFQIISHFQAPGFGAIVAAPFAPSAEPTRNYYITSHFFHFASAAVRSPANSPQPSSRPAPACHSTCRSPTSGIHYFICDTIPLRRMPHLIPGVQSSTLERAK